jgi:hypothetical protein
MNNIPLIIFGIFCVIGFGLSLYYLFAIIIHTKPKIINYKLITPSTFGQLSEKFNTNQITHQNQSNKNINNKLDNNSGKYGTKLNENCKCLTIKELLEGKSSLFIFIPKLLYNIPYHTGQNCQQFNNNVLEKAIKSLPTLLCPRLKTDLEGTIKDLINIINDAIHGNYSTLENIPKIFGLFKPKYIQYNESIVFKKKSRKNNCKYFENLIPS